MPSLAERFAALPEGLQEWVVNTVRWFRGGGEWFYPDGPPTSKSFATHAYRWGRIEEGERAPSVYYHDWRNDEDPDGTRIDPEVMDPMVAAEAIAAHMARQAESGAGGEADA